MPLYRKPFLESLSTESKSLQIVFINHCGSPDSLLVDLISIDLLASRNATEKFKNFCLAHPLVKEITLTPQYRRTSILVTYVDGSQLNFRLLRNMTHKSLKCLPFNEILAGARTNEHNMLVPSHAHHFEYIFLKYQFQGTEFPDKFKKYFSSLDKSSRQEIFGYIQPRFNLVFNTIEDLYKPKGSVQLKVLIGLRRFPFNSLFRMFFRGMEYLLFSAVRLFYKGDKTIEAKSDDHQFSSEDSIDKQSAGKAIV
jgi:hypothetical protein